MRHRAPLTLLVAMLVVTAARAAEQPPAPPGIEVRERVFDAGKVDRGVTLRHTFLVKNNLTVPSSIDAKPG